MSAPVAMSAANEAAVALFLAGRIGFNDIYDRVAAAVERTAFIAEPTLDDVLAADGEARRLVYER